AAIITVDLVVDANDKVHIVRRDNGVNLHYHTNKSGSWVGGQINGTLQGVMQSEALTVNSAGDVLLIYNAQTTTANLGAVSYACLFNGASSWQTGSVFSGGSNTGTYASVAFNSSRVAMVMFDHYAGVGNAGYASPDNPRQLQYATATISAPGAAPTVTTPTSASVAGTTATLGGNVTADGGAGITVRGVVVSATATNSNPQLSGTGVTSFTTTGTTGVFTVNVTDLTAGTGYSYKAYATNASGTGYSSVGTFTTTVPDTTAPTVASVVRQTPSTQSLANSTTTATFRVTYSEAVTGVAAARFAVEAVNGGTTTGTVGTPVAVSASIYDVPVTITGGSGEFRLKVID
ncbi:MAG: hypothetical protein NTV51_16850, partial [Verrucomicrobia bacterium]|nr:hypothetical protein [Verrucomicrobiota bacterium]